MGTRTIERENDRRATAARGHVCPWWAGYVLASPLRRLLERPERTLAPHVRPGDRVLEVGPGMGFFTLPLLRMVGEAGRVIAVDVQPRMLSALERRAQRKGLAARLEARLSSERSLELADIEGTVDLAVLIYVLHELPDVGTALAEVRATLTAAGRVLLIEPAGHVSRAAFEEQLAIAGACGLALESRITGRSLAAALRRAP